MPVRIVSPLTAIAAAAAVALGLVAVAGGGNPAVHADPGYQAAIGTVGPTITEFRGLVTMPNGLPLGLGTQVRALDHGVVCATTTTGPSGYYVLPVSVACAPAGTTIALSVNHHPYSLTVHAMPGYTITLNINESDLEPTITP